MTRSARGTRETPGRKVRQKSGLNRSILSRGWGTFLSFLEDKLTRRGGRLVRVDPRNTSRTCSDCGHVSAENRPDQATFRVRLLRLLRPRRCQCGQEHTQSGARPSRLFAGATRRVRRLTLQVGESIPAIRGDGRKESPSLPLSRRAKRKGGEDVNRRDDHGTKGERSMHNRSMSSIEPLSRALF